MKLHLERALLLVGLTCLGFYGIATLDAKLVEQDTRQAIARTLAEVGPPNETPAASTATLGTTLVGLLEIPRLGLSTPVVHGDDERTLAAAAGHLPDTPWPWQAGNSAIAAHRDGLFRPLRGVRVGDAVVMRTPMGELSYRVTGTRIVEPTDLSVLDATSPHMLTLITCYPFNYVGAAPKRFIVHAERVAP